MYAKTKGELFRALLKGEPILVDEFIINGKQWTLEGYLYLDKVVVDFKNLVIKISVDFFKNHKQELPDVIRKEFFKLSAYEKEYAMCNMGIWEV